MREGKYYKEDGLKQKQGDYLLDNQCIYGAFLKILVFYLWSGIILSSALKENMDTLSYKTKHDNIKAEDKAWFVVDASNQTLGRLSTQIATAMASTRRAQSSLRQRR